MVTAVKHPDQLTPLQQDLLRALWGLREASVGQVQEALRPGRQLAPTSVATLLGRLREQGLVERRRQGRQFLWRACVEEEATKGALARELYERHYEGDLSQLVAHLLEARDLSTAELDSVRKLIDGHVERRAQASDEDH